MIILGIHHGHDSCAALVRDGELGADVAEERFVRLKHYCGLPFRTVQDLLGSERSIFLRECPRKENFMS